MVFSPSAHVWLLVDYEPGSRFVRADDSNHGILIQAKRIRLAFERKADIRERGRLKDVAVGRDEMPVAVIESRLEFIPVLGLVRTWTPALPY